MHNLNVQHDINNKLFFAKVKGGMAQLTYDRIGEKRLDFKETRVPEPSRGMGVARHLIESALAYAKERDISVKPSCPVVQNIIRNSDAYQHLEEE
ncbi:N-acetyltransferase [Fulvivirga sp. 29W222]|uniref:N-acetyltransferase n=1 Tax=Fulvivirga marina TaxID=2494733 RepID=A0A937FVN7_9BACT|nr:GNAT family N-acetyltransferase [Fulvivirga marina]MBL6445843.1 N-acetyltransferase [Fulvivirga marina]